MNIKERYLILKLVIKKYKKKSGLLMRQENIIILVCQNVMEAKTKNGLIATGLALAVAGIAYYFLVYKNGGKSDNFNDLQKNLGENIKPNKDNVVIVKFKDNKYFGNHLIYYYLKQFNDTFFNIAMINELKSNKINNKIVNLFMINTKLNRLKNILAEDG